jgi:IS605 OrfB family transposase
MYKCQQTRIKATSNSNSNLLPILEHICATANNLINCGIYFSRQTFFNKHRIVNKYEPINNLKEQANYKALHSQCAQQVLKTVAQSFKSYKSLVSSFFKGEVNNHPKLPNYRTKGGFAVATYPKQALKFKEGKVRVPLGKTVKAWFGLSEFFVSFPPNLDWKTIKELRILPRNQEFYIEWVYQVPEVKTIINSQEALGIDPGIDNWLTCVSTIGESFIIDGKKVKSLNQNYNRRVSSYKKNKPQNYWNFELARITEKRNRQIKDAVNKAAKMVVNYCLNKNIGTIVFGWNKQQRQCINIGKKNNQNFVQIPTARLKNRIKELAEEYNIKFIETEESYTSKASFLDGDELPTFGEKPKRWQPSGARITRGCYQDSKGRIINADAQAAANILRKVEIQLGLTKVLAKVSRAVLTLPTRLYIWNSKRINNKIYNLL